MCKIHQQKLFVNMLQKPFGNLVSWIHDQIDFVILDRICRLLTLSLTNLYLILCTLLFEAFLCSITVLILGNDFSLVGGVDGCYASFCLCICIMASKAFYFIKCLKNGVELHLFLFLIYMFNDIFDVYFHFSCHQEQSASFCSVQERSISSWEYATEKVEFNSFLLLNTYWSWKGIVLLAKVVAAITSF